VLLAPPPLNVQAANVGFVCSALSQVGAKSLTPEEELPGLAALVTSFVVDHKDKATTAALMLSLLPKQAQRALCRLTFHNTSSTTTSVKESASAIVASVSTMVPEAASVGRQLCSLLERPSNLLEGRSETG
jgi:hypothetical protein